MPGLARDPKHRAKGDGIFAYTARGKLKWGVEYRDPRTWKTRRKVNFPFRNDVVRYLGTIDRQRAGVLDLDPDAVLIATAVERYIQFRKDQGRSRRSYDKLGAWTAALPGVMLSALSPLQIRETLAGVAKERGWSPATRNNALSQLSGLFSWALAQDPPLARSHPIRDGRVPLVPVDNARERWLTAAELDRLESKCPPWMRDLVRFSAATGMRRGEACGLRVRDYRKTAAGSWLEVRQTKSRTPLRFPLEGWLAKMVARKVKDRAPEDRIFPGPGGLSAETAIKREFPGAVRAAKLTHGRGSPDGVTWHTLRHTFASHAFQAGASEIEVMALGNWRDPRMLRRYLHLGDKTKRTAAGKIAKALRGKLSVKLSGTNGKGGTQRKRRA